MAVLRDMTDDGITCEDPEQVGRRKYIAMSQLHHPQQPQPQQQQQQQDREGEIAAVNETSVAVVVTSGCPQQQQHQLLLRLGERMAIQYMKRCVDID